MSNDLAFTFGDNKTRSEWYDSIAQYTNSFTPSQPDTGVTSSNSGRSTGVAGGNYGREIQYTARIHF